MVQVLKQCGNDLSRDNIMKQAANLTDVDVAAAAAGHHDQHLADELQSDPPDAARDIQRRKLGAVRGRAERLKGRTTARRWELGMQVATTSLERAKGLYDLISGELRVRAGGTFG